MMLLAIEQLEVVYHRSITAVQGITLAVAPAQVVALLGTNGAGKTTTLRAISGFLGLDDARVTQGAIMFNGERIENSLPHQNTARGIVLVPERDKVFPNLTVAENLSAPIARGTAAAEQRRRESALSPARGAAEPDRRPPLRRRAADAGLGERHHLRSAIAAGR
jgi:branched-chain amino acid transport system ATP-binding protein